MQIRYQNRTGLLPEHDGINIQQPTHHRIRLTVPAYEALLSAGAAIAKDGETYAVDQGERVPEGLVACHIAGTDHVGVRRDIEPEFPGEIPSLWDQVDFTPCPECGAPLIWYEAGYVPGYRVCSQPTHHHVLVIGRE